MNIKRRQFLVFGIFILMNSCTPPSVAPLTAPTVFAPTVTPIPSPTIAPAPIPPMLSASIQIPCRTGPGELYDLVLNLPPAQKYPIVAKAEMYWLVKLPDQAECYVHNQQVRIVGDISTLSTEIPPPTPASALPAPPEHIGLLSVTCSIDRSTRPVKYVNEFRLEWTDASNNEDGFRIYRDGGLVAEVPANQTDVIDVVIAKSNHVHYYFVIAYNEVGISKSETRSFSCGK